MSYENNYYMTLPSNVKSNVRKNKTSHFLTELPKAIEIERENWEAALVEIDYPHSWYNVKPRECRFSIFKASTSDRDQVIKQVIVLTPGYYNSAQEIIRDILEKKNNLFSSHVLFDSISRKVRIYIANGEGIHLTRPLANLLGFLRPVREFHENYFEITKYRNIEFTEVDDNNVPFANESLETENDFTKIIADRAFDIYNGLNSIYVYTNIIEDCIVGNASVPLLRNVLVSGSYGDIVQQTFIQPHYLRISQNRIKDIEIILRDDKGDLIPFEHGKVIVKLHFRRKPVLV